MKLTIDEREFLQELVTSPGWNVLLSVIDDRAKNIDSRVLLYNLDKGPDGLVIEKARSEGSRKLQVAIQDIKKDFRTVGDDR